MLPEMFFELDFLGYWFGIGIAEICKINQYQYNPSFRYGISIQCSTYCSSVADINLGNYGDSELYPC